MPYLYSVLNSVGQAVPEIWPFLYSRYDPYSVLENIHNNTKIYTICIETYHEINF